ncbi:MAG: hypothetical protein HY717_05835 [Planctomycetes bacterium]|nr:hypothetical protein [Planctomycetota bacterium]
MKKSNFHLCMAGGAALGSLLFLAGCGLFSKGPPDESSADLLVAYGSKVETTVLRLKPAGPSSAESSILFPEADRRVSLEAALHFQETLAGYHQRLEALKEKWSGCSPADLNPVIADFEKRREDLQAQALQINLQVNSLEMQYESFKLETKLPLFLHNLKPTSAYLAACQRLSTLAAAVKDYLSGLHQQGLSPAAEGQHPASRTFHFLLLYRLRHPAVHEYARLYESAWKEWVRLEVRQARFDRAMEVVRFAAAAAPEFRPSSPQEMVEITNACLERIPPPEVLDQVERSLAGLEAAYRSGSSLPGEWGKVIDRARGILLFCRAQGQSGDPRKAAERALQAAKMNPFLANRVNDYLFNTAHAAGRKLLAAGRHVEAFQVFSQILAPLPSGETYLQTLNFREEVIQQALADSKRELDRMKFQEARGILTRISPISDSADQKAKVSDALYHCFDAYSSHLLNQDIQKALSVCRETLAFFPSDERARRKIDRGLYLLLTQQVGDPETAWQRLGAEKILEMIKATVNQMPTLDGPLFCRDLHDSIERAWRQKLQQAAAPGEAFSLASELTKLNPLGKKNPRREGAGALWRLAGSAAERQDWDLFEGCIDTWLSKAPDVERPPSFKACFLQFIDFLAAGPDSGRLEKNLAVFRAAYPSDEGAVKTALKKRLPSAKSPGEDVLAALEAPTSSAGASKPLPRLWQEPKPREAVGSGEKGLPGKPSWIAISLAVLGASGSLLMILALPLATWRRGLLSFRWYGLGALWLGLALGFYLGT